MTKPRLFRRLEGQVSVQRLQQYAIVFVVIGVVLAVGLSILGNIEDEMYTLTDVSNETHATNLSDTGHEVITVDNVDMGLQEGSETLYDPYDSSVTLTEGENYTVVSYSDGKFNVTQYYDGKTSSQDLAFDYTYKKSDTTSKQGAQNAIDGLTTFTEWLPVIALVVTAAIIIGLVSMFNTGNNGRRGRA